MSSLFGSVFEMSIRIVLLLSVEQIEEMSLDRIIYYDFIITYGNYFELSEDNLHGDNDYGFGELARRRKIAREAMKDLVINRYVGVNERQDGMLYSATSTGAGYARALKSEYANSYRLLAEVVADKYKGLQDYEVMELIDQSSRKMIRGGAVHD